MTNAIVNFSHIEQILNPLIGGADNDEMTTRYENIDVNDEAQVRSVIREILKPEFESKSSEFKLKAKAALAYGLLTNALDFGRTYDRNLLPFDHPDDPRTFFVWLWHELFCNDEIQLDNLESYTVINE